MKLNIRPIRSTFLKQPGIYGMSYETLRQDEKNEIVSQKHDLNFTIYKDDDLIIWLMLCPCNEKIDAVELKQRYLKEGEECSQIEEGILNYAENWARENKFRTIYIYACDVSIPYYERHGFISQKDSIDKDGVFLFKMTKAL